MVNTLIGFSTFSTTIALLGMAVFFGCILLRKTEITESGNASHILKLLRLAETSSVLFCCMAWLTATCLPWEECLEGYAAVGARCKELSEDWLLAGICLLVGAILLDLVPRQDSERFVMYKFPASSIALGFLFWVFSVLLTGL